MNPENATLVETVMNMSDEEVAAYNKKQLKQAGKLIAIRAGISVALGVGAYLVIRHMDKKAETNGNNED